MDFDINQWTQAANLAQGVAPSGNTASDKFQAPDPGLEPFGSGGTEAPNNNGQNAMGAIKKVGSLVAAFYTGGASAAAEAGAAKVAGDELSGGNKSSGGGMDLGGAANLVSSFL